MKTGDASVERHEADAPSLVSTRFGELHYVVRHAPADAPRLHFAHATGFHARTYTSFLEALCPGWEIHAPDQRGHGASQVGADPETLRSWQVYVEDIVRWVDAQPAPVVLAGHSLGATASLMAAGRRPEKVAALMLFEPVLPPRYGRSVLRFIQRLGLAGKVVPLAVAAARRKTSFESREAALARYRGRGAFATWTGDFLEHYVQHGLVDAGDGRVTLACKAEWESRTFAATHANPLRVAGPLDCPALLMAGASESTSRPGAVEELRAQMPNLSVARIANTTHFLPMEVPDIALEAARLFVERLPL